ncbi:hypothetical protein ACS0TY_008117 [Phlomoides rotata]
MAFVVKVPLNSRYSACKQRNNLLNPTFSELKVGKWGTRLNFTAPIDRRFLVAIASNQVQSVEVAPTVEPKNVGIPIMVNGCTGKMGRSMLEAAISAGLNPVPVALGDRRKVLEFGGKLIEVYGPTDKESIISSALKDYPDLIVVDYTVPAAVNGNVELYCKYGVPFVLGTTGGDTELLYKTVDDSKVYAVISPQMGKQVVAFLAAMEIMAEQFPGAFSGYNLLVVESHQAGKLDISGTAKDVISCFQKLGVSFELEQVHLIRDPRIQMDVVGVPEEHLSGHAFHTYRLTSPDGTVVFEFQHNVCGRSSYAEGTVDATLFLAKKVKSNAEKRIYDMIDVLREGSMR